MSDYRFSSAMHSAHIYHGCLGVRSWPGRAVLWGGRRGDIWIGSAEDRRRQREIAAFMRLQRAWAETFRRLQPSIEQLGRNVLAAAEAFRRLQPSLAALQNANRRPA